MNFFWSTRPINDQRHDTIQLLTSIYCTSVITCELWHDKIYSITSMSKYHMSVITFEQYLVCLSSVFKSNHKFYFRHTGEYKCDCKLSHKLYHTLNTQKFFCLKSFIVYNMIGLNFKMTKGSKQGINVTRSCLNAYQLGSADKTTQPCTYIITAYQIAQNTLKY